jgi:hypothetical protein
MVAPRPPLYARFMFESARDRASVLFVGLPQALALSGVIECEQRGWSAQFVDEVVDGLDHIDTAHPDVVVVPLKPPHLDLDEFCAVAMRGTTRQRRAIIVWPAAPASPAVGELVSRSGVVACGPGEAGTDRLCTVIPHWIRERRSANRAGRNGG